MERRILAVEEPLSALERTPIEISETRAKEIAQSYRNGPRRNVVISQGNKWYDISHMTEAEIMDYLIAPKH
jgi:hypothetical protein